jgi:hypothetical protein
MRRAHDLPSPSAVVEAIHRASTRHGAGRTVHGRTVDGRGATHLATHVGGDVGTSTRLLARVLTGRGSGVDGQIAHAAADLISHVCGCCSEIGRKLGSDFA